ncbi:hypothetical protein DSL64_21050 [Dyadobacter luteus]|uniref:Glycosyltransferase RgtA/B/C/D-like domain-containing protein n=1 Tax=Dyadobacter luteus TaxID=2259619 RepID=A0A3D8Y9S5_9BACT|nr:hypothetical protein DSL64_21050 [Dyadobacter luteus]
MLHNPFLFEYFGLILVLLLLFGATFVSDKLKALRPWVAGGLIIAPVVYFYLILSAHLVNVPFTDDYNLLETIYKFRQETNFVESMKFLFEQINQHRFPFERTIMLIMVFFTGTVNIKVQILVGNMFMLGILFMFFRSLKKEDISWYYFIPVPYILFNLVYFENAFWGIAAIQNTPLLFFAFLSAYGLGRNDQKGLVIGIVAAIVTTYISGSGMLTWISGALILILQRRFSLLFQWAIAAAAVIAFYFLFDYHFITSEAEKPWKHPIYNLIFALGFWGNAFYLDIPHPSIPGFYTDMILCVLAGAVIGLIMLMWLLRSLSNARLHWTHWLILGALMFVIGTGCMFVLSRPLSNWMMHGGKLLSRRYMIFGIAGLATAYVALIIMTKGIRQLQPGIAIFSMLVFLSLHVVSYFKSIPQLRKQYEELSLDGYFFQNFSTFLTTGNNFGDIPFWNHPTRMKELVSSIEKDGLSKLYESNQFPAQQLLIKKTGNRQQSYQAKTGVSVLMRANEEALPPKSICLSAESQNGVAPSYFVLNSDKYTILLPALPVPHSVSDFLTTRTYYQPLYEYTLFRNKLPAGNFSLWMMSKQEGKWISNPTGKTLLLY